jgi:hypothetical protein
MILRLPVCSALPGRFSMVRVDERMGFFVNAFEIFLTAPYSRGSFERTEADPSLRSG